MYVLYQCCLQLILFTVYMYSVHVMMMYMYGTVYLQFFKNYNYIKPHYRFQINCKVIVHPCTITTLPPLPSPTTKREKS